MSLVRKVLDGDRLSLARLITKIENRSEDGLALLDALFPHTGKAHLIGITGSPGSGKSSLVNQLVRQLLQQAEQESTRIAVVAVDPTSPFSGGALLGDRVRMRELMLNPNIFIRSMASRGALGGLAHTTGMVTQVLDAAGYETILIETVGAGQTEVEIAGLAHTVLVVEAPGMGDDIQAIKAGILEIADILVVNKADLSGVERTVRALRSMLEVAMPGRDSGFHHHPQLANINGKDDAPPAPAWIPPVVQTVATEGMGLDKLLAEISKHKAYLLETGQKAHQDQERLRKEVDRLLKVELYDQWLKSVPEGARLEIMTRLANREISPQAAARRLATFRGEATGR